eukprot:CAMPEP_0181180914 /NCGR_PEP_ID=MMETSP1096-20121128/7060_1 /TAXON_ID=156174 ORGANISM="Chrysochromulina ericina, Strain CCMP281" /NCGR_SAMPLE_ID=MMETSP1096 /ASSEMBLY_ACC=CAM_ASM_000453 /LENGTH=194 /DNA_ID=CAMNT_0023269387 /DNA_START=673 /DNA_END=1257 /DNA_ORIENTATION=+
MRARVVTVAPHNSLKVLQPLLRVAHILLTVPKVGLRAACQVLAPVKDEFSVRKERTNEIHTLGEDLAQDIQIPHKRRVDFFEAKHPGTGGRVVDQKHHLTDVTQQVAVFNGASLYHASRQVSASCCPECGRDVSETSFAVDSCAKPCARKPPHVHPCIVRLTTDAIAWYAVQHTEQMGAAGSTERDDEDTFKSF